MQLLWGSINTLQIFSLAGVFNLNYPTNVITLFGITMEISSFSLIPTAQFVSVFTFKDSEPINDNFSSMGYSFTPML